MTTILENNVTTGTTTTETGAAARVNWKLCALIVWERHAKMPRVFPSPSVDKTLLQTVRRTVDQLPELNSSMTRVRP
jgi:hypothetical protein